MNWLQNVAATYNINPWPFLPRPTKTGPFAILLYLTPDDIFTYQGRAASGWESVKCGIWELFAHMVCVKLTFRGLAALLESF